MAVITNIITATINPPMCKRKKKIYFSGMDQYIYVYDPPISKLWKDDPCVLIASISSNDFLLLGRDFLEHNYLYLNSLILYSGVGRACSLTFSLEVACAEP